MNGKAFAVSVLLAAGGVALAQVRLPYTFTAGAPARAAEVNANFAALASNASLYFAHACDTGSGGPGGWCQLAGTATFPNSSAYTSLGTIALPDGDYFITAKLSNYPSGTDAVRWYNFECQLADVALGDAWNTAVADYASTAIYTQSSNLETVLHFQHPFSFATGSGGTVRVACRVAGQKLDGTALTMTVWGVNIAALRVASIAQP
jgi:hypothetical protein